MALAQVRSTFNACISGERQRESTLSQVLTWRRILHLIISRKPVASCRGLQVLRSPGAFAGRLRKTCFDRITASTAVRGEGELARRNGSLEGRVVAFTTPLHYASRFEQLLRNEGAQPLWCPTIVTTASDEEVECHLRNFNFSGVHGIAFTSRAGIEAFANALGGRQLYSHYQREAADPFIVAALGKDAELLDDLNLIADRSRVSVVVPDIATPQALVEALGEGRGRKLVCPVPLVVGLEEPPVVPHFLQQLCRKGWDPIRVNSYVTSWLGPDCAKALLDVSNKFVELDALVFTSSAEIEGFLKSLASLGHGVESFQKFVVAAHGPVTAAGAERLGVQVDVIGKEFQSFFGVIRALKEEWTAR